MLLAGLAALVGVGFGYFLRWIISLGQRGSVELRIKQMELDAKEEAKKEIYQDLSPVFNEVRNLRKSNIEKSLDDLDPQKTNKIVVEAGGYAKMETEIPAGQLKDSYNFLLQQEPKSP